MHRLLSNRLMWYSPDVANLNLVSYLLHWLSTFPFYWSSRTPTSSKLDRCLLLSITSGFIAPTPTSMSGWVSEWAVLFLHLPHVVRSGGRHPDPAGLMGKPAFVLFSAGWLVHNLRAQRDEEIFTMCRRRECSHAVKWRRALGRSSYKMCIIILCININYLVIYYIIYTICICNIDF